MAGTLSGVVGGIMMLLSSIAIISGELQLATTTGIMAIYFAVTALTEIIRAQGRV